LKIRTLGFGLKLCNQVMTRVLLALAMITSEERIKKS